MAEKVVLADKFVTFTEIGHRASSRDTKGTKSASRSSTANSTGTAHTHDELFLCISGELEVEFRARTETLLPGELLLIETGEDHRPAARKGEVQLLMLDPAEAPNTGDPDTATVAVDV